MLWPWVLCIYCSGWIYKQQEYPSFEVKWFFKPSRTEGGRYNVPLPQIFLLLENFCFVFLVFYSSTGLCILNQSQCVHTIWKVLEISATFSVNRVECLLIKNQSHRPFYGLYISWPEKSPDEKKTFFGGKGYFRPMV